MSGAVARRSSGRRSPSRGCARASWAFNRRCSRIPIERGLERLLHSELRQLLVQASQHVIDRLVDLTEGSSLSFTLTDADGLILVQRGNARLLAQSEQAGVVLGTRWAELDVGTNGIGTALASRQTMQVFAAEHYCETFHSTTCTAALVRHPITRQAIGVFDITSGYAEPATNVWALATQAATLIEREIQRLLIASDERLLVALAARPERPRRLRHRPGRPPHHRQSGRDGHARAGGLRRAVERYSPVRPGQRRTSGQTCFRTCSRAARRSLVRVNPVPVGEEPVGAVVVLRENRRRRSVAPALSQTAVAEDWTPFKASARVARAGPRQPGLERTDPHHRRVGQWQVRRGRGAAAQHERGAAAGGRLRRARGLDRLPPHADARRRGHRAARATAGSSTGAAGAPGRAAGCRRAAAAGRASWRPPPLAPRPSCARGRCGRTCSTAWRCT